MMNEAEFNRRAAQANRWAREAEARRLQTHSAKRASASLQVETDQECRPSQSAPMTPPSTQNNADAQAARILRSVFGGGGGVRSGADIVADAEAERIVSAVLGARDAPAVRVQPAERRTPQVTFVGPNTPTARARRRTGAQSHQAADPEAARILECVFG